MVASPGCEATVSLLGGEGCPARRRGAAVQGVCRNGVPQVPPGYLRYGSYGHRERQRAEGVGFEPT